jgi:hypothetical protein
VSNELKLREAMYEALRTLSRGLDVPVVTALQRQVSPTTRELILTEALKDALDMVWALRGAIPDDPGLSRHDRAQAEALHTRLSPLLKRP